MDERVTTYQKIRSALRLDKAAVLVWKTAPFSTTVSFALVIIQSLIPLATLYVMKLIVDAVTFSVTAPDKSAAFKQVLVYVGFALGLAIINALCGIIATIIKEAQAFTVSDHIASMIHAKSIEVDLEYYDDPKYFNSLHLAQTEGATRPVRIVNSLMQLGQNLFSLTAMAALLFSFHWSVSLVIIAAAIPGILVKLKYSGIMFKLHKTLLPARRNAAYFNYMLTGDTHAKEVRIFGLGDLFIKKAKELRKTIRSENLKVQRQRILADLMAQGCAAIMVYSTFGFIAYSAVQGTISLGDLVMYYQAFQRGLNYFKGLLAGLAGLYEDNLFIANLYDFLDFKPKLKEPEQPKPVPRPMKKGFTFNHVSFKYPSTDKNVLKDISLSVGPGEVVALVGENGSGKTTLVKLLCRLYDPSGGTITMDGVDLRSFESRDLRKDISIIFQDFIQYHLTAKDNIWYGNIDIPPDLEQIRTAANHAEADQMITDLPKAYETFLGKWIEDGEELSKGQWQKIALARAFMRDSQIIVLDEPTSSLDPKSEYAVFKKFRELLSGRSAVLISHRFSTVRMADRIFVLKNGEITESGPHDKLIQKGGTYAQLYEKQAQYYR